jgi:DNA-binding NarL/FixJ family response regulator
MSKIKIVLIEDQNDVAENIVSILGEVEDIELRSVHFSAEDAVKDVKQDDADIYLVDLGLPGMSGVEFIAQLSQQKPDTDFIVHTISENGRDLMDALSAGAVGYIIKGCADNELINGIRTVASGGGLISPRMARRLFHYFKDGGASKAVLTKTEVEVLNMLKTGASYETIALSKNVSLSTVQSHIKNIYRKLDVNNRNDAVLAGSLFGLIER